VRRDKRDRDKPIPRSDLDAIAKFRAELTVYDRLRKAGDSHDVAQMKVFGATGED
jgi:hypothetical protein